MLTYLTWRMGAALARGVPLHRAYRAAALGGLCAYYLWPRGRRATNRNFAQVLPEHGGRTKRRVARRSMENYGRYLVDFARLSADGPIPSVESNGHIQRLQSVMKEGNGAILAVMHFGNWDAGAALVTREGIPLTAVADRFDDAGLDREVLGTREAMGMEIAVRGEARKMVRALKDGRALAMLVDRPASRGGVAIDFFGSRCVVPGGAARLAMRTGAPVIPVACYRVRTGVPEFCIWADWDVRTPDKDTTNGVQELTQAIYSAHERLIRRKPSQWYMFRDLWVDTAGTGY